MTAEKIKRLIENRIGETDIFLVEVFVGPSNTIRVLVDRPGSISIGECADLSRYLYGELDRDVEDYSLEVSSPGLGSPFRVRQQYTKTIGRDLEVLLNDGTTLKGRLDKVEEDEIILSVKERQRRVAFDTIKKAKEAISFN